jgi:uncharacterized protein YdcH (DUF465 family)
MGRLFTEYRDLVRKLKRTASELTKLNQQYQPTATVKDLLAAEKLLEGLAQ